LKTKGGNPKARIVIITIIVCVLALAGAVAARLTMSAKVDKSAKELEELEKEAEQVAELKNSKVDVETERNRLRDETLFATIQAEDEEQARTLQLKGGHESVVLRSGYMPILMERIELLALRCGLESRGIAPMDYEPRKPKVKDPRDGIPADDTERLEEAQAQYENLTPERKALIDVEKRYAAAVRDFSKRADMELVEIKLSGSYQGLFLFLRGLVYPLPRGFRFHEPLAIRDVVVRAERDRDDPYAEPELTITLDAVAFRVKPPEKPKEAEEEGATSEE
jgi:hypothetical protein